MQHRSIFQCNTVFLASVTVQPTENTVYSLHWHLSNIQNIIVPKTDTYTHTVASLVYFHLLYWRLQLHAHSFIVNFMEMFTCESPTQVYVFVYTTFGRCLEDLKRLWYLGHDRTCDLHPFFKNLAKKGSVGANILLDNVGMIVDLFHCKKHTELLYATQQPGLCISPTSTKICWSAWGEHRVCWASI